MSKFGRSIRIYLSDGTPSGLRHVEIANWSGQALACPRSRFAELGHWDESKRPGIYFLFESSGAEENNLAYIGESEDVFKRLSEHDRKKDFWNELIIFTSKDENLTKSHVKYLEARLVELSKEAERYKLENSNTPTKSSLPRADSAAMEEFIDNIRIILGSLGHRILDPFTQQIKAQNNHDDKIWNYTFKFTTNNLVARGKITDDGFLLLKDSEISKSSALSMPPKSMQIKEQLLSDGALKENETCFVLLKDKLISSSSYAASLVAGNSRSGPQSWKSDNGETLKAIEEQLIKKLNK